MGKTHPTFRLSNRQRKDLMIRQVSLKIVLPVPSEDPPNWKRWARQMLPDEAASIAHVSEPQSIPVACSSVADADGLADYIGRLDITPDDQRLQIMVEVVVVTLTPPGSKVRHRSSKLEWPGSYDFGDVRLPPKKGGAP